MLGFREQSHGRTGTQGGTDWGLRAGRHRLHLRGSTGLAAAGVQPGQWQGERQGAAICGGPECPSKELTLRPDAQGVRMRAIVGHRLL